jgi:hypothetical protein
MPALANLASRVVAEEVALRRPMIVVLREPTADSEPDAGSAPAPTPLQAPPIEPTRATRAPTPLVTTASNASQAPSRAVASAADERTFDVPIRMALAPTGV